MKIRIGAHQARRLWMLIAMAALLAVSAPPVAADQYGIGGSDTGWIPDNHDHDYCWSTNFTWTSLRNLADDVMDSLEATTDFSGGSHQSCNSGTDVYFQRFNTTAYRGQYQCDDRQGTYECDNADVRVSSNTSVLPTNEREKTLCHEVGHSAGARHHSSGYGCMVSGASTATAYWVHTKTHMNSLTAETNASH